MMKLQQFLFLLFRHDVNYHCLAGHLLSFFLLLGTKTCVFFGNFVFLIPQIVRLLLTQTCL